MAEMYQMSFVDTDAWIEEKEGITVSEIFAVKGEAYFRNLETQCLRELLKKSEPLVLGDEKVKREAQLISVGGGLPVREENRQLLRQLGQVIYLKASPDTIYDRVKSDTTRPLLQTDNPLQKIIHMLAEREEKYQQAAHRVVSVDEKSISEIIQDIVKKNENTLK